MTRPTQTVLIGLDGATFTVLDPLMERGVMPNLAELVAGGTRAPLRTIMPPLTPPAWTSLMTGKRPGQHGVFDFFQKESPDSEYYSFATSREVDSPTIWSLASDHGRRVISLNYPLMFPPPAIEGAVVPGGWMPWRQLRLGCHPPGLFDRLKKLPSFEPKEMALDMQLEAKAIDGCAEDEYADWIELHTRRERRWFDILEYLLVHEQGGDLVGVMFDGPDKLQHLCWRFIDVASRPRFPNEWERGIIKLCEDYFRGLDRMIGQIVELAADDATIILASDHGFGPAEHVLYINAWLHQQGWLAFKDKDAPADEQPHLGFAEMTRHVYELDWERTVAYAATPTSQGINIVRRTPDGTPLPSERRAELREEIAAALRELRHPETGDRLVLDVHFREEVYGGPHEHLGPDLSLVLADGVVMSILQSEQIVRPLPKPYGTHQWQGIFIASGPEIRQGARLEELSILDVAPTVLYSLDVPLPDDLAGRLPEELFEDGVLERRPPRRVPAARAAAPELSGVDAELEPDEEQTIVNRLRALGYVE